MKYIITMIALLCLQVVSFAPITPSVYTGTGLSTNLGGKVGIGVEVQYKKVSANAAIGGHDFRGALPAGLCMTCMALMWFLRDLFISPLRRKAMPYMPVSIMQKAFMQATAKPCAVLRLLKKKDNLFLPKQKSLAIR